MEQYMGVSKNSGTPKWMVYNGKPIILGNPYIDSETKNTPSTYIQTPPNTKETGIFQHLWTFENW